MVGIEHTQPPHTSNIEEFPTLSLPEAMMKIKEAQSGVENPGPKEPTVIVPHIIWSRADEVRLKAGQHPKGYPEHNL